jgi:hypothetical protein
MNKRKTREKGQTERELELRRHSAASARPTPTHVCEREGVVSGSPCTCERRGKGVSTNARKIGLTEALFVASKRDEREGNERGRTREGEQGGTKRESGRPEPKSLIRTVSSNEREREEKKRKRAGTKKRTRKPKEGKTNREDKEGLEVAHREPARVGPTPQRQKRANGRSWPSPEVRMPLERSKGARVRQATLRGACLV